jgi:AmiR/NasT family two-component response regulator
MGTGDAGHAASLADLLQTQTARLASMEVELDAARRALHERKVIERAKGALMSRLGLTEEAAFRSLQKASMDHNRRLLDVAEATLALPDAFFARVGPHASC